MSTTTKLSKSSFPFHPFILLFVPLLVIFRGNIFQVYPEDLVQPYLILIIPVILLVVGFYYLFKRSLPKSGLFVSLIILLFFSYGKIENWFLNFFFGIVFTNEIKLDIPFALFIIPFIVVFLAGLFYCLKTNRKLDNLTKILNVVSIALVGVIIIQFMGYDFSQSYIFEDDIKIPLEFDLADGLDEYPDIYYIVLDAYAGSNVLSESYEYENTEFINFLDDHGFNTPEKSQSNYTVSFLSLSSALNMQHVTFYTDELGIDSKDRRLALELIHENRVMQILESNGYKTISVDSNWGPTNAVRIANENICEKSPLFNSEILTMSLHGSMLKPIYVHLLLPADRERVLCIFSELPEIHSKSDKPIFVLAHIMLPHGPYVWGPNGEHKRIDSLSVLDVEEDKHDYLDQLKFTNKMVQETVDRIIDENKSPKIIIIQSDHGHAVPMDYWNPTDQMIIERFSNINYILVPEDQRNSLYDHMTPTNVFRVLFNSHFNTNLEILDDRVFFSGYDSPYDFVDVTHIFR